MAVSDWSTTAGSNATQPGINFAEGQAPSSVNDSARQVMADIATLYAAKNGFAAAGANSDITSLSGLTTPLSTAQGGTGAANLNALAKSGANSDITSLAGLTTPLSVAQGGSGAATLTGLIVGNGTSAFSAVTAPSGTVVGTSDSQTLTNKTIAASGNTLQLAPITNSISGDVACNNTANYFDGPSVAQGTSGTWYASGTVSLQDGTAGVNQFYVKLWDGTTVIASAFVQVNGGSLNATAVSLSGYLASPAGNLRISVRDASTTAGKILFSATGNGKDSTITAFRIA